MAYALTKSKAKVPKRFLRWKGSNKTYKIKKKSDAKKIATGASKILGGKFRVVKIA